MGPLFSVGLMAILGSTLFLVIFFPSMLFLKARRAFLFAAIEVIAIGFGGFVGLLISALFFDETLKTPSEVYGYFSVALAIAAFTAFLAALVFRKLNRT